MLVGSSGTMHVTVNEQSVYQSDNPAGRGYSPDTDTVRLTLTKGRNRILVVSRQGIGPWCFSVQIAGLSSSSIASRSAPDAALEPSRDRPPQMIVAALDFQPGLPWTQPATDLTRSSSPARTSRLSPAALRSRAST